MHVCLPWNVPSQIPLRYFFSWSRFDHDASVTKDDALKHTHTSKVSLWVNDLPQLLLQNTQGPTTTHSHFFYFSLAFSKAAERQYTYTLMCSLITLLVKNDIKWEAKGRLNTQHPFGLESQATVIELPSCCCMVTNARRQWALERRCAHLSTFQVDAPTGIGDWLLKCVWSQFTD